MMETKSVNHLWGLEPIRLESNQLLIHSYKESDLDSIVPVIHDPNGWFGVNWKLDSLEKVRMHLENLVRFQTWENGRPLVYKTGGEVAGITRYMRIDAKNKTLEIGGTWVAPRWRRTSINTSVKYHLLNHAFETLQAERVEFRVDARNFTSQVNVLRIGATFEGRLRHRQIYPDGLISDGMLYSITKPEWPKVKIRLRKLLAREIADEETLLPDLKSDRLTAKILSLQDTLPLIEIIKRNREDLIESFPESARVADSVFEISKLIAERAHQAASAQTFFYMVRKNKSDRPLGQLHIKSVNWPMRSAELGYFVDKDFRRQGYCTEMIEMAVKELFVRLKFNRIYLRIISDNEGSMRLARKLGFQEEGVQRSAFKTGTGKLSDVVYFGKLRG